MQRGMSPAIPAVVFLALLAAPAASAALPGDFPVEVSRHIQIELVKVILGDCGVDDDEASGFYWGYEYNAPVKVWVSHPNPKSGTGWTESTITVCVHP